jgi:hypothetical protein
LSVVGQAYRLPYLKIGNRIGFLQISAAAVQAKVFPELFRERLRTTALLITAWPTRPAKAH